MNSNSTRLSISFSSLCLSSQGGGLQSAMIGLASSLRQYDEHRVTAVGIQDSQFNQAIVDWSPVSIHGGELAGPKAFGYSPELSLLLEQIQPDIVHQHGLWTYTSIAGFRWCSNRGKPFLVSPHNMLDPWALSIGRIRKAIAMAMYERSTLNKAGCVHALVPSEVGGIRRFAKSAPICVIPNGVRPVRVGQVPDEISEFLAGEPYFLYLGRLHAVKNVELLIRAWAKLEQQSPRLRDRLLIAGWGSDDEVNAVSKCISETGVVRASYVGPVFAGEKAALFSHAKGFILPSANEGLPMVCLEAMAYGTPIIITEACNLNDASSAGAALRVHPSVDDICRGISQLIEMSADELDRMGKIGARLTQERYSWRSVSARFTEVYEWLVGGGQRPDSVV